MVQRDRAAAQFTALLLGVLSAFGLGALLWRLLWRASAHTFDPMIYARSLWGIAHGDYFNPVVSSPIFGIHGQFVQFLLAPFTRFIDAATVLAYAQAIAFGATAYLVATGFARISHDSSGRDVRAAVAGGFLLLASPLVVNAFLFDVRPELLGVPLIVAGGLRALLRDELDGIALTLLLSSLAVREDYAITIAPMLVFIPVKRGLSMRIRFAAAAAAVAYFAIYYLVLRRILGGDELVSRGVAIAASGMRDAAPLIDLFRFKLEIVVVAAATIGAFVLRSGRWFLGAVPALLAFLALNRGPAWTLNTHYSMFAAPALAVAGVAGYRRWVESGRPHRRKTIVIAMFAAATAFFVSSSAPGGGRYLPQRFAWSPARPTAIAVRPELTEIRRLLAAVPSEEGLAVPFAFGATLSDRRVIVAVESISLDMQRAATVPDGVQWLALRPSHWKYGRRLVQRGRFVVHGEVRGAMVLLRRVR